MMKTPLNFSRRLKYITAAAATAIAASVISGMVAVPPVHHSVTTPSGLQKPVSSSSQDVAPATDKRSSNISSAVSISPAAIPAPTPASMAALAQAQAQFAKKASPSEVAQAEAIFQRGVAAVKAAKTAPAVSATSLVIAPASYVHTCITITRSTLEAAAWLVIVYGAVIETVGIILDFTGVGAPLGVVLNIVGLWVGVSGAYMLWWVDNYYPSSRTYCGWYNF